LSEAKALGGIWETLLVFFMVMGHLRGLNDPTEAGAIGASALCVIALLQTGILERACRHLFRWRESRPWCFFLWRVHSVQLLSRAVNHTTLVSNWIVGAYVSHTHIDDHYCYLTFARLFSRLFVDDGAHAAGDLSCDNGASFRPDRVRCGAVLMMERAMSRRSASMCNAGGIAKDSHGRDLQGATPFLSHISHHVILTIWPSSHSICRR